MEMKTDIIIPVPSQPAQKANNSVAAEKPVGPAGVAGAANGPDLAAVQEFMREALQVDPIVEDRELRIEFEKDINQMVVKVLDKETGELVRQIPMPEEISIARGLREAIRKMARNQSGIAVDREV